MKIWWEKLCNSSIFFWVILSIISFSLGSALAASPFSWNINAPANTDAVSIFPALYRLDKTVLGGPPSSTGGILGTLAPYGTAPSTGFRENQINDDSWVCQNAFYTSATSANRDDTTKNTLCVTSEVSGPFWRFMYGAAAANPITFAEVLRIVPAASTVNSVEIDSSALGSFPSISVRGSNLGIIYSSDSLFKSGRPWIDVIAEGAKCDGTTDDSTAFNNSVAALPSTGGTIYVPQATSGCLLNSSWNINKSNINVIMDPGSFLILGSSVVIGSTTSNFSEQSVKLYVKGSATPPTQLVQLVNAFDDHLTIIQIANCACDILHVQSVGGKGAGDNVITVQSQYSSNNGIIFENGNATTASIAGDFVNGNVCFKCDFPLVTNGSGVGIGFRGTGTFTGSVAGTISRNTIWRSDISQFNGNGNCIRILSINSTYNEIWNTTCEVGGGAATYAIDTTTASGVSGSQWRIYHLVAPGRYDQQHLGLQDLWWGDEGNNTMPQGTLASMMNVVNMTVSTPSTISTTFVSSGNGINGFTPKYLTTVSLYMSCYANNNTAGDGVQIELVRSTVGIPSNGGALGAGDVVIITGPQNNEIGTSGGFNFSYPFTIRDSGLTINTQVFYYLAYKAITGGTVTLTNCSGWAAEQ